jgi:hypothetical protein
VWEISQGLVIKELSRILDKNKSNFEFIDWERTTMDLRPTCVPVL